MSDSQKSSPGTVILTGANGSLALGIVQHLLASYPGHTHIFTLRNPSSTDQYTAKLKSLISKYPGTTTHLEQLDLSDFTSVRTFSSGISEQISSGRIPQVTCLILNAFTWSLSEGQKFAPSNGYEMTFAVNHLGHSLLTLLLLKSMSNDPANSARIVLLASTAHSKNDMMKYESKIPEDDNMDELVKPKADKPGDEHDMGFLRYGVSKLASLLFAGELLRRVKADPATSNIEIIASDPGGLPTSRSLDKLPPAQRVLMKVVGHGLLPLLGPFVKMIRTTNQAGKEIVIVGLDRKFASEHKSGYYDGATPAQEKLSKEAQNEASQRKVWDKTLEWVGATPEEVLPLKL